ncbi:energy transducer TonB [Vibrio sp. Of7-15]|uniref:energy transducer TonB n=1 Tax=Vibrio sp. Of7-15 TaxID=2724879 RepID=UPI001EF16B55|nr:energy transducer TonB [Vibrio sp. Of7-15]MCG7499668.1 energy transducer TonB [Vibrio sp. Of7-15]
MKTAHLEGFIGWIVAGIFFSLLLHVAAAVAYFWTPRHLYTPPPAAAPIAVSLVAPLSSPKVNHVDVGEAQQESMQSRKAEPQETTEPKKTAAIASEEPPIVNEKAKVKQPVLDASPKPAKPLTKIVKKQDKTPKKTELPPKPKQDPQKDDAPIDSLAKKAAAQPTVQAPKQSEQVSAPFQGQLSHAEKTARIRWQQALHAHLEKEKRYPRMAKRMRKQGMPVIDFVMTRDGKVLNVRLVRSSGVPSLDNEALDLAYRAQPLPKPPEMVIGEKLTMTLPINFSL